MPKRSRKLPVATPRSVPDFSISDADWRRIETRYGEELSGSVRDAILQAAQEFVYADSFERSAEPVADAVKLIETYKKAATGLSHVMSAGGSSDARAYAKFLVMRNFQDARLSDTSRHVYVGPFYSLGSVLNSFIAACDRALRELEPELRPSTRGLLGDFGTLPSFNEGEAFGEWIRQLTKIVRDARLPWKVRKDTDKTKHSRPSPFVAFVSELQECLPAECKRPYAQSALPTAIGQARRKSLRLSSPLRLTLKSGNKKPRAERE